jgi:FixJ family two-component response regulator
VVVATNDYRRLRGLTTRQKNAIDLLVRGTTDEETAGAVGVHRVTVTKATEVLDALTAYARSSEGDGPVSSVTVAVDEPTTE